MEQVNLLSSNYHKWGKTAEQSFRYCSLSLKPFRMPKGPPNSDELLIIPISS